jgi:tetratricopeptide (TPR) repeat protein
LSIKTSETTAEARWIFRLADIVANIEDSLRPSRGARGILITTANVSERLAAAAARYPIRIYQYKAGKAAAQVPEGIVDLCDSLIEQSPNRPTERRGAEVSSINISGSAVGGTVTAGGNAISVGTWPSSASDRMGQEILEQTRILGPHHPSVLSLRARMAEIDRSVDLFRAVLADQKKILGSSNPETINTMVSLAAVYQDQGRYSDAVNTYKDALELSNQVEDSDNAALLRLRIMDGLAGVYISIGDIGQGIPLYEQTLADRMRLLGQDHPDTLTSRNNLALAYQWVGDRARAIPLYEQTLADSIRVLGEDHPSSLTTRNNLATAYRSVGNLARALELFEQTLTGAVRTLGEDHPDTLRIRFQLALTYETAGELGQAIVFYEKALADSVRILGENHPLTEAVRTGLTRVRQVQ